MSGPLLYSGYSDKDISNCLEIYTDHYTLNCYNIIVNEACIGPVVVFKNFVAWQIKNDREDGLLTFHVFHKKTLLCRLVMFDNVPITFKASDHGLYIYKDIQGVYSVAVAEDNTLMMITRMITVPYDISVADSGKMIFPKTVNDIFNGFHGFDDTLIISVE